LDGREKATATISVNQRLGQPNFRARSRGRHQIENGLLLRADLHNLFDQGRITVRSDDTVAVAPEIHDCGYRLLDGKKIALPAGARRREFRKALAEHRKLYGPGS
jgi:putative restriction endonuclease